MPEDVADAVLDKVKHFTIGFGRAGDTPAAKGTGVLVKHGELYGILTCAHVDKHLRELKQPVGTRAAHLTDEWRFRLLLALEASQRA
jgi:hypothetical protein